MTINFTLNGNAVVAEQGQTLLDVAKQQGIEIPHLCYSDRQGADGNCRACMVEVDGERVLAPSCCRQPSEGMNVQSNSERAIKSQKMVLELLKSDVSEKPHTLHSELDYWASKLSLTCRILVSPLIWMPVFNVRVVYEPVVMNKIMMSSA